MFGFVVNFTNVLLSDFLYKFILRQTKALGQKVKDKIFEKSSLKAFSASIVVPFPVPSVHGTAILKLMTSFYEYKLNIKIIKIFIKIYKIL